MISISDLAGTSDAVVMVEAGANELPEETMVEAIRQGHEAIQQIVKLQQDSGRQGRQAEEALCASGD